MKTLLDQAIDVARQLPSDRQDEVASMLLLYARLPVIQLTPEEEADLAVADAEVSRGEIATDDEMRRLWAKYGP